MLLVIRLLSTLADGMPKWMGRNIPKWMYYSGGGRGRRHIACCIDENLGVEFGFITTLIVLRWEKKKR